MDAVNGSGIGPWVPYTRRSDSISAAKKILILIAFRSRVPVYPADGYSQNHGIVSPYPYIIVDGLPGGDSAVCTTNSAQKSTNVWSLLVRHIVRGDFASQPPSTPPAAQCSVTLSHGTEPAHCLRRIFLMRLHRAERFQLHPQQRSFHFREADMTKTLPEVRPARIVRFRIIHEQLFV